MRRVRVRGGDGVEAGSRCGRCCCVHQLLVMLLQLLLMVMMSRQLLLLLLQSGTGRGSAASRSIR